MWQLEIRALPGESRIKHNHALKSRRVADDRIENTWTATKVGITIIVFWDWSVGICEHISVFTLPP